MFNISKQSKPCLTLFTEWLTSFVCIHLLSLPLCVLNCKLFSWGWLYVPLLRNSCLLYLVALILTNLCANKGCPVLTNAKSFVSAGHRFSTASKGIFFFPLHPIWKPEQISYQGSKFATCSIQNRSHPLYYSLLFPSVYQLNCSNFYGRFWQTSITQFTYYPSCYWSIQG